MAKQVGLFGLRGKIENKSFYKTAGVQDTVIRQIPEGLGARVKTSDEYANTRLNNAEFKNANAIATKAFNAVSNRNRGMMRRFAIADMTKRALEDIKNGTGAWGARKPATEMDALICDMLENYAKGGVYDGHYGVFSIGEVSSSMTASFNAFINEEKVEELINEGIDAIQVVLSKSLAGEIIVDDEPRLYAGSGVTPVAPVSLVSGTPVQIAQSIPFNTPASVGMSESGYTFAQQDTNHGFFLVVTILPLRRIGTKQYVLQEKCTYVALPIGQFPD